MVKFLDAALNGAMGFAGKAYFFRGAKYVRFDWTKDQGDPGYPLGLDEWGFPAPFDKGIDAAIEGRGKYEKKAFFFKDDKFLQYDWAGKGKVDAGYPKSIDLWKLPKDFFSGGKKKIDAAINGAGQHARYWYLLSGTNWVRVDWKEEEDPVLHKGTLQADWGLSPEIAKGLDAALSGWGKKYGNKAYFFAGQKYATFDWTAQKCDSTNGDLSVWELTWDDPSPGPAPTATKSEGDKFREEFLAPLKAGMPIMSQAEIDKQNADMTGPGKFTTCIAFAGSRINAALAKKGSKKKFLGPNGYKEANAAATISAAAELPPGSWKDAKTPGARPKPGDMLIITYAEATPVGEGDKKVTAQPGWFAHTNLLRSIGAVDADDPALKAAKGKLDGPPDETWTTIDGGGTVTTEGHAFYNKTTQRLDTKYGKRFIKGWYDIAAMVGYKD